MFTLEIAGTPIAVTNADEEQAREVFEDEDFKDDLRSMSSNGTPLWDGTAAFVIRPASEAEATAFDESVRPEDDDEDAEGGVDVLFVVPVDDEDHEPENDNAA
jgi:hypothetical protein